MRRRSIGRLAEMVLSEKRGEDGDGSIRGLFGNIKEMTCKDIRRVLKLNMKNLGDTRVDVFSRWLQGVTGVEEIGGVVDGKRQVLCPK